MRFTGLFRWGLNSKAQIPYGPDNDIAAFGPSFQHLEPFLLQLQEVSPLGSPVDGMDLV